MTAQIIYLQSKGFCSTFNDSVHLQGSGLLGFDSHFMLLALLLNNKVYVVKEIAVIYHFWGCK